MKSGFQVCHTKLWPSGKYCHHCLSRQHIRNVKVPLLSLLACVHLPCQSIHTQRSKWLFHFSWLYMILHTGHSSSKTVMGVLGVSWFASSRPTHSWSQIYKFWDLTENYCYMLQRIIVESIQPMAWWVWQGPIHEEQFQSYGGPWSCALSLPEPSGTTEVAFWKTYNFLL